MPRSHEPTAGLLRGKSGSDTRPVLLDLFCKAGGCTKGYQQAGFYVVGVDIEPQPNYCGDEFHQADALTFPLEGYDAAHASPPCQAHSTLARMWNARADHLDLIPQTRQRLRAAGIPYVIENVEGAPLLNPVRICGSSIGLPLIRRHRLFESNVAIMVPPCSHSTAEKQFPALDAEGRARAPFGDRRRLRPWWRQARRPVARCYGDRLDDPGRAHAGHPAEVHRTHRALPDGRGQRSSGGRGMTPVPLSRTCRIPTYGWRKDTQWA